MSNTESSLSLGDNHLLKYIKCPDSQIIEVINCIKECHMGERCLTLPTIMSVTSQREWTGTPSTTQLLNGTMMEYLKIVKDWVVDPQQAIFASEGSNFHAKIASHEVAGTLAEVSMKYKEDYTGIADCVMLTNDGIELIDYKLWGSYKIAKALGLVQVAKKTFTIDSTKADLRNEILQLNNYRIMLEEFGPVKSMKLQATVRDGGTYLALSRGVVKNIYTIPVPKIPDLDVLSYFARKRAELLIAINTNTVPSVCSEYECWEGRRCKEYCVVAQFCPKGKLMMGEGK